MTALSEPPKPPGRLHALDYMRLAAAFSVLTFHYFFNGILNRKIASIAEPSSLAEIVKYGHLGVNWFFLISGFIIFHSARGKTAREFAVGRLVRLFPAFWAAIFVTTTVIALWGARSHLQVNAVQVAANLTMVPGLLGVEPVDGVYWTLQLEIIFYVTVFAFLGTRRLELFSRLLPAWTIAILVAVVALGVQEQTPLVGGYFALFASGALLAEIQRQGWSVWRAVGLIAGLVASAATAIRHMHDLERTLSVSFDDRIAIIAVLLMFASISLLGVPAVRDVRLPAARAAGALTYPLYLIHAHVGYIAITALARPNRQVAAYALTIAAVLAIAWTIHRLVERRAARLWFRVFDAVYGACVAPFARLRRSSRAPANPGIPSPDLETHIDGSESPGSSPSIDTSLATR